jgi:hypothetical protein
MRLHNRLCVFGICCVSLVSASVAWAVADAEWKSQKSSHFVIKFKQVPAGFIDKVLKNAEEYYQEITQRLGFIRYESWSLDQRATIYIFPSREEYLGDKAHPDWSLGVASPDQKIIKSYPADTGFIDTILPHELGHIIFQEFSNYNPTIPRWLDEGVACNQELAQRWGSRKEVLDALLADTFIPLELLNNSPKLDFTNHQIVSLFYAESASLVNFLIERFGAYRFSGFCRRLGDGADFTQAFFSEYPFRSFGDLSKAWLEYIRQ